MKSLYFATPLEVPDYVFKWQLGLLGTLRERSKVLSIIRKTSFYGVIHQIRDRSLGLDRFQP